ncbi:Sm-like protein lsm7 [Lodderomyces elongisporus]|uniref:Sm-like protein lsm7 n=1 Tax=Lodderomyces elongisporus TaxID=36914 RepID=UPI00291D3A4D|nr:Sm-like protein lsm7 [Lodderomyces elongisporus]WLF80871.1 Sm-like protein lsm7 [Lodderomyces elongisporus]
MTDNEQKRQGGQRQQNKRRGQSHNNDKPRSEGPKREAILDLNKHKGEEIRVRCVGGRQITGILKGFDQLMNLVLEDVTEQLRDPEDEDKLTDKTRQLGLVVVRCTSLMTISPVNGSEIIDNPFVQTEQ